MAREETFKVIYIAPGLHSKTFANVEDAVKFVAKLEAQDFMGIQKIVTEDMPNVGRRIKVKQAKNG